MEKIINIFFIKRQNLISEYQFFKVICLYALEIKNLLQKMRKSHVKCKGKVIWFKHGLYRKQSLLTLNNFLRAKTETYAGICKKTEIGE